MTRITTPKSLLSIGLILFSNVFLVALSGNIGGLSLFYASVGVSLLSIFFCWLYVFGTFNFSGIKEFKMSIGVLSSFVLLNGFIGWSQGTLQLNSLLITALQSVVPYLIVSSTRRLNDNLLFDFLAMGMLFAVPSYFAGEGVWLLKNGISMSAIPLIISSISAAIIFKDHLNGKFHLPLGISKEELLGALFVVAATVSSLVFVKAFFGESSTIQGLNWKTILPFGWCAYLIPAIFAEVLYRAVFMSWISKITGSFSLALFSSSVLFAILESGYLVSDNRIALIAGVFLGLFNGIAYEKIGSLTVPIIANVGFFSTLVFLGI